MAGFRGPLVSDKPKALIACPWSRSPFAGRILAKTARWGSSVRKKPPHNPMLISQFRHASSPIRTHPDHGRRPPRPTVHRSSRSRAPPCWSEGLLGIVPTRRQKPRLVRIPLPGHIDGQRLPRAFGSRQEGRKQPPIVLGRTCHSTRPSRTGCPSSRPLPRITSRSKPLLRLSTSDLNQTRSLALGRHRIRTPVPASAFSARASGTT